MALKASSPVSTVKADIVTFILNVHCDVMTGSLLSKKVQNWGKMGVSDTKDSSGYRGSLRCAGVYFWG